MSETDERSDRERTAATVDATPNTVRPGLAGAGLPRGATLGRYVVLSKLGAGAMGVVLAAYDPKLDRKIAIKLLALREPSSSLAQVRLEREAQALAKLDHPNVVGIHDVGVHDGQLFVAMEFVDGQTLGAWLRELDGPPPWREVVGVFVAAGRGLAAAHEAGLVHRDFKPDNVMLGRDKRVRVMDFGLARTGDAPELTATIADNPVLSETLTRTGALLGTPAYMAPEQFDAATVDARSDQFGFCVALYEALYGQRPFAGRTVGELADAVRDGRIQTPPKGATVPGWLRKLVVRGLAPDPRRRFDSMTDLLAALTDDPVVRRRKWALAAALLGALSLAGWGLLGPQTALEIEADQACEGMADKLEGVWDEGRRAKLRAALVRSELSFTSATWDRVEARLDRYATAWVAARTDTCRASQRGEQSDTLLDLRMACFDERLMHLRATVDVLADADASMIPRAVEVVASLPTLDRCADSEALLAEHPIPDDPDVAAAITAANQAMAEARAIGLAGRYLDALARINTVVTDVQAIGHEPLAARTWLLQGALQARSGEYQAAELTLVRAYDAAVAQRMAEEAASAAASLVRIVGDVLARPDEGRRWALDAEPLTRAAGTPEVRAKLLNNLGLLALSQERHTEAEALFSEALGLREPDSLERTPPLHNLATIARAQANDADAQRYDAEVLSILQRELGPEHPALMPCSIGLGEIALRAGDLAAARTHFERAVAVTETLGREHGRLVGPLVALANLARTAGEHDEARTHYERAAAIVRARFGPEHPKLATALTGLGETLLDQGEADQALAPLETALAIRSERDDQAVALATTRFALARALWQASDQLGRDQARAKALVELARQALANAGEPAAEQLAALEAWRPAATPPRR